MSVQLTIDYETLVQLVEQLPDEQKHALVERLIHNPSQSILSPQDKVARFQSMSLSAGTLLGGYSDRRADWYDEDGR